LRGWSSPQSTSDRNSLPAGISIRRNLPPRRNRLLETPISTDLRESIRAGNATPAQKLAVFSGGGSLAAEHRAELLTLLTADSDPAIAERAQSVILTQPLDPFLVAIASPDADPRLFSYCADNMSQKPGVADALAKNPFCPTGVVAHVASRLSAAGVQALLDNLDRLSSDARLVVALTHCKAATPEQQELLLEIQKTEGMAVAEIEEAAAEIEPDLKKRVTLLQRLAHMNVVERIQLALKGGREERMLLIRDPNKIVQRGVLQSPRLTDLEIENFAAMTNVSTEVLRSIAASRVYMKAYTVVKNLVRNPKTPLDVSMHLLQRLNAFDLKLLTSNKNIPETLRSTAVKLHRQRASVRPPT
jgi:hypothetical protein